MRRNVLNRIICKVMKSKSRRGSWYWRWWWYSLNWFLKYSRIYWGKLMNCKANEKCNLSILTFRQKVYVASLNSKSKSLRSWWYHHSKWFYKPKKKETLRAAIWKSHGLIPNSTFWKKINELFQKHENFNFPSLR